MEGISDADSKTDFQPGSPSLRLYGIRGTAWVAEPHSKGERNPGWIHKEVPVRIEAQRDSFPVPPYIALENPEEERGRDCLRTFFLLEEAGPIARQLHEHGLDGGRTRRGGWPIIEGAKAEFTSVELWSMALPLEQNEGRLPPPLASFGGERTEAIWYPEVGGVPLLARGDWRSAEESFREDSDDKKHPF